MRLYLFSDRTPDCIDGSDEGEHCKDRVCDESMYRCPESGRCIPISWLCDVDKDCSFGEDGKCSDNFVEYFLLLIIKIIKIFVLSPRNELLCQ